MDNVKNILEVLKKEALLGIRKGDGGPFSAVVVKDGKMIAKGHNMVVSKNNPILHAEIVATMKASKKLKRFDLRDCEIYSSCEPCPMCFSALHWARYKKVYFVLTRKDASKIGFDDNFIYEVLAGKKKPVFKLEKLADTVLMKDVFSKWKGKMDKIKY
ncbi:MAG: nucleoside deaminase [Candidatus Gracilibacteria bacterium]|jgi:guanine deaminase|nr:nucleoside deaminase [Candidatus Gracilibacteria bacterium]